MRSTIAAWGYHTNQSNSVNTFCKKSIGELWKDEKGFPTNNTALIHTHTRAQSGPKVIGA